MPHHRDGKKIRGTHTTFTDLAADVTDIICKLAEVDGVSPGLIQQGKGVAGGMRKVKIGDFAGGIILKVRQSRSVQELRVFASNVPRARLAIARALRDDDIPICFKHE
ncbi:MAG: hypothetical protein AB200_00100 [Parcubacteria bacterium C7867-005]|nr:MAG: hypothetical protein AB200_00100 [Parcubacteria bacterium C7867-005]